MATNGFKTHHHFKGQRLNVPPFQNICSAGRDIFGLDIKGRVWRYVPDTIEEESNGEFRSVTRPGWWERLPNRGCRMRTEAMRGALAD
jgi:hypothetical protein